MGVYADSRHAVLKVLWILIKVPVCLSFNLLLNSHNILSFIFETNLKPVNAWFLKPSFNFNLREVILSTLDSLLKPVNSWSFGLDNNLLCRSKTKFKPVNSLSFDFKTKIKVNHRNGICVYTCMCVYII